MSSFRGVHYRTIFEPLQCCPSDALSNEMVNTLKERGFDVAGVQTVRYGPVIGFVIGEKLRGGRVKDHTSPMNSEHLISDATPLGDLLTVLRVKERVFVLFGSEVKGIITRADLNKPPVRVYLFGVVSLLEMHLHFWVRRCYGDDSWEKRLNKRRLEAASNLQKERLVRNEGITLFDCLQFCDKRNLLLASSDLRAKLGLGSKNQADSLLGKAEELRNRLAHSQHDLVQGSSWQIQIDLIEKIEALVNRSDDAVEQEAKSSRKSVDALWATA